VNEPPSTPGCDYCGLPVAAVPSDSGPRYCCFGCKFAASITASSGDDGQARWMMTRLGLAIFFTMNVMVFTMILWSQQDQANEPLTATVFYGLARHACLLFTAPVLLLLGGPLCNDALDELKRGRASLNLLLLAGVTAAFLLSAWATWRGEGHVYFEVSCMVLLAVTLGRWLEATGKLRTTATLRDLRKLLCDRVRRVADGVEQEIELSAVRVGDVLRVLPGEHLPTDGTIVTGVAAIDEQTVTGESMPAEKRAGDPVYSGTCNLDGELLVAVTAAPGTGTLEKLLDAVTAAASNSRQQRLAETIAAWFLPLVLITAAVTCAVHWRAAGPAAGLLAGLAVVIVSCPCALGLATPMALWAATGEAMRKHVLVRDADAFAALATADTWCFDKTGTLTTGCRVTAVEPADDGLHARDLLALAAALAGGSTHILSTAILEAAADEGVMTEPPEQLANPRTIPGCGVEATLADGRSARLGSGRWITGRIADENDPQCLVAIGDRVLGGIRFAETIRGEAATTLVALRARGARTIMLSGDRAARAQPVADMLGLECRAPLLPGDKLAAIERLSRSGHRVVMVGDGINDAPALTLADVGVALGCGADVSRWSADICLLRDDLASLPWLVDLARRTSRTVRWNLLWAFGYNAACIPLAASGLVHPAIAAAAMVASSLFVVTNSLRLASPEDE
jgi:heavy metal translocating P-type ATPase